MDISVSLDAVGGEFNAFTAKEYTVFHARVLDDDLPLAVDVLGDMITSSLHHGRGRRGGARGDPRRDRDARRRPRGRRHRPARRGGVGERSARAAHRRLGGVDPCSDPGPDHPVPPHPLPAGEHRRGGRRQRRPHRGRAPGPQGVLARQASSPTPDARPSPPRASGRFRRAAGGDGHRRVAPSSRSTWWSASTGWRAPTSGATPSACSTRRWEVGPRLGSSRRSVSGAGWPTRSTPTPRTTPTPGRSASGPAACPASSTTSSAVVREQLGRTRRARHHRGGARPRQGPAARWARARAWRTPGSGCRASPRRSCSTATCPASRRSSHKIDAVTLDDVQVLARRLFRQPESLAVVGPVRS